MPRIIRTTRTIGPAHLIASSPYSVIAQKPATIRKLSHGSPVLHVIRPTTRLSGRMNGWEKANALVTAGGVATSSGDLRCTRIVERCFVAVEIPVFGEKAAWVGGLGSLLLTRRSSMSCTGEGDISAIQGVSAVDMKISWFA